MKIGILTFVHAYNYGAELQCFALQRKLRNMGYDCEVLNIYRPADSQYKTTKESKERFKQLYSYNSSKDLKAKMHTIAAKLLSSFLALFYNRSFVRREKNFSNFHKMYTNLSSRTYTNFFDLYSAEMPYTHLIVGSDQVWNFMNEFSVEPYFLTFAKKSRKISYAASIGHADVPIELQSYYKIWSSDFYSISLREERGVEIMKEITGRDDITCVLDPTLLLTKKEWCSSLKIIDSKKEKYVLLYLLSMSSFSIELAKQIARDKGYSIKIVSTAAISLNKDNEIEYYNGVSPRIFVELFASASFVITNSFHGTAFAINFNIPFYSTTRKSKRYNSRFINLLSKTYLIDRLIYEEDSIDIISTEVIFDKCNYALETERTHSLNFIEKSIQ